MSESILDAPPYGALDPDGMYGRLQSLPDQMEDAWHRGAEVELPDEFREARSVLILGMGGSAAAGSLLRAYAAPEMSLPVSVCRGYGLPAWAGEDTLVIAISYSGNTEETLSALVEARERGCRLLTISADGEMSEFANTWQIPTVALPAPAHSRAPLAYLFFPLLRIVERLDLLSDQSEQFSEALSIARDAADEWGSDRGTVENLAKQVADDFHGRVPVIYAAEYLAPAARRWKALLNENSKSWALWDEIPELNHNAIVGYQYPGELVQLSSIAILAGSHLNPRVKLQTDMTGRVLDQFGVRWRRIEPRGSGRLSQLVSHLALGEYVTYYLALRNGTDPTAVEPITFFKRELAGAEGRAGIPPVHEPGVRPGLTIPREPEG